MKKVKARYTIRKKLLIGFLLFCFGSRIECIEFGQHFSNFFKTNRSNITISATSLTIGFFVAHYIYDKYKKHYENLLEENKLALLKILIMDLANYNNAHQNHATTSLKQFMESAKQKLRPPVKKFYGSACIKKRIEALYQIVKYK